MLLSGVLLSSCSKVAQVPSTPVAAAKALGEFPSHCRRRQHSSNTPTKPSPPSPAIPVCSNHLKSSASRLYLLLLRRCAPGCAPAKPARYWAAVEGQEGCSGALWLPPNWFQNKIAAPTNQPPPPTALHPHCLQVRKQSFRFAHSLHSWPSVQGDCGVWAAAEK